MTEAEIIEIADKAFDESSFTNTEILRFAKLIAELEREECAKIADEWVLAYPHPSKTIAELIRKRGQE
jgi:hypothetical protein